MKGFFVALLALPAILAAPVNDASWPTTFPINTFECCCTDGGERSTSGSCLAMNGAQLYSSEWVCYYDLVIFPYFALSLCILYYPLQYYSLRTNQLFESSATLQSHGPHTWSRFSPTTTVT